jgi:hypothetical protein
MKLTNQKLSFVLVPNAKACLELHEVMRPKFWLFELLRLNYRTIYTPYYEMNHFLANVQTLLGMPSYPEFKRGSLKRWPDTA